MWKLFTAPTEGSVSNFVVTVLILISQPCRKKEALGSQTSVKP
jgi:hypothetical protein